MTSTDPRTAAFRSHAVWRSLIAAAAVVDRALRVDGVVDGEHSWRQAHVVANVECLLQDGLFALPRTHNADLFLHLYDVPVWQSLVALLCRATDGDPTWIAEALNVGVFAATLALVWRLADALLPSRAAGTWALLVLALSPLGRCYAATPVLDPFVVALATWSWAGFVRWRANGERGAAALLTWWLPSWLAAFVKCPIELPIALGIVWASWARGGPRAWRRPPVLVWLAGLGGAVLAFRWLTAVANADAVGWPDLGTELAWYFGDAAERGSFAAHQAILTRIGKQVVPWPLLALAGIGWLAGRRVAASAATSAGTREVTAHALAAVGVALLFLHVNRVHSYYQLPCLVPLALWVGAGIARVGAMATGSPRRPLVLAVLLVALLAGGQASQRQLGKLLTSNTGIARAAGAFVAAHAQPDDFVLYGTVVSDDSPALLLFARRDGANVLAEQLANGEALARWGSARQRGARRLCAFVPAVAADVQARLRADPAWQPLATDAIGALFTRR